MLSASASPRMYYVHMFRNKGTLPELPEEMVRIRLKKKKKWFVSTLTVIPAYIYSLHVDSFILFRFYLIS